MDIKRLKQLSGIVESVDSDGYNHKTGKYQISDMYDDEYWATFSTSLQKQFASKGFSGKMTFTRVDVNEISLKFDSSVLMADITITFSARSGSATKPSTYIYGEVHTKNGYETINEDLGRYAIWSNANEYADDIADVLVTISGDFSEFITQ